MANLQKNFYSGKVFAVNPKRIEVLGLPCFAKIGDIPQEVDLAVVVTPAATVPAVIGECTSAGARSAIVISAGFKEMGSEGAELEREIQGQLGKGEMRLVGPNCLGMMNPRLGLNATFSQDIARPGSVAFLSQSGALLTAILDWSLQEAVGFSAIVSIGSMLDVSWGDLISYLGEDAHTEAILLYMESIGDARAFLSAAREVALKKPIIVIKGGRSEAASRAASSHTGALTGSDEVFDAALRRCGVLRVRSIADLFYMADVLGKQPRPQGPRLTILTNAGGPGVLATDALILSGGKLAELSRESLEAFNAILPPHWSHSNPIDILGDAEPQRYARAFQIAMEDPASDGVLVILAPQGMTDPAQVAERLKPDTKSQVKPVLATWMGGRRVAEGKAILNAAGIPTFNFPDTAARAFTYMWRYGDNIRGLYESPAFQEDGEAGETARTRVDQLFLKIITAGRSLLTEIESKEVLKLYGIKAVQTVLATSAEQAIEWAATIGFPVVLKLHSEAITHKSDVGGVKLNLQDEEAVREAFDAIRSGLTNSASARAFMGVTVQPMIRSEGYELIIGCSVDEQFGPVILFGSGGQLVEVHRDRVIALPPLNSTLALRLMEQTKVFDALQGIRGRTAVDITALARVLVRFSQLVVEHPRIKEVDINPLLATPKSVLALDARIVLYNREVADSDLPRTAVCPYPSQYISKWKMKDGADVLFRPIRPEDESLMVNFHKMLSNQSVYLRYFHMESLDTRIAHDRLIRKCFIDYDREMALVVVRPADASGEEGIVAVGRLTKGRKVGEAEVAVLVSDQYQKVGLGSELLRRLIQVGRDEKLRQIVAHILPENTAMRSLANRFAFQILSTNEPTVVVAVLPL